MLGNGGEATSECIRLPPHFFLKQSDTTYEILKFFKKQKT